MITENDHARWRAAMDAGAPEALSDDELEGMLAHADECADCAPALRDFAARALAAQAPAVRMEPARAADVRRRVLVAAARPSTAPRKRRPGYAAAYPGGWMAAAALVVALLTHHAFHEPLEAGWFAAALFALLALGLGYYAMQQRRRMEDLQHQLDAASDTSDGRRA
ncbi:MAG TPA: hypothetical protein VGB24_08005 [Longimicrobium sp.]|jgi:hypothetical protein|uniref:hypothetical protein n=1 Tax=Longimicrobium sp. TaxID=2029185 RepID=UPI002ED95D06